MPHPQLPPAPAHPSQLPIAGLLADRPPGEPGAADRQMPGRAAGQAAQAVTDDAAAPKDQRDRRIADRPWLAAPMPGEAFTAVASPAAPTPGEAITPVASRAASAPEEATTSIESLAAPAGPANLPAPPVPERPALLGDESGAWLRTAVAGLAVLAAAAAAVSFTAQYQMVNQARRLAVVAGLEAVIPDAAALIFACLGIALALHGRMAWRARLLNVIAVGTSVFMNAIAAAPGWRPAAIWVMPPVAYALASDTLIGVVRARAVARRRAADRAGDGREPLGPVTGTALWLLRLGLAPVSTLRGFRSWVTDECPVAPGRRVPARPRSRRAAASDAGTEQSPAASPPATGARKARSNAPTRARDRARSNSLGRAREGTKTARFLALAAERHGGLAAIGLDRVGRVSAELAPEVGLHAGAARTALRRAVLAARNGEPR